MMTENKKTNLNRYLNTDIIEYNDRWVVAQYKNISLSVTSGLLESSEDNSITFTNSLNTSIANLVINAHIFRNGNILLVLNDNRLFLTNYKFTKLEEKKVLNSDGLSEYPIHTPVNANFPGRYWYTHKYPAPNEESDIYIWGNYCNVSGGAAPVNLIYTKDFGETIKIAYEFGQLYRDNGTGGGSTSTGTLLGDASNPIVTRHTHCVEYCRYNDKYYVMTGDFTGMIEWLKGSYDDVTDTFTFNRIDFGFVITPSSRLLATSMFFVDKYIYWCSDTPNVLTSDEANGIWISEIDTFSDVSTHRKVLNFPNQLDVASTLKIDPYTKNILFCLQRSGQANTNTIGFASNYGQGNVFYIDYPINYGFIRLNTINDAGYFRYDTSRFNVLKGESFLIKVGFDEIN